MKSRPRRQSGFTLIEVLLVLVILVILASLATVNILSAKKKADIQAAKTQVLLFDRVLDQYYLDVQQYPSGLEGLRSVPADIPDASKWHGPYLDREVPNDPWGKVYSYNQQGHNGKPDVWTTSPDGQEIANYEEPKK